MPNTVKIFKNRSAELGEPNKFVLAVKLASPTVSCGIRKKIIPIKKRQVKTRIMSTIMQIFLKNHIF